MARVLVVDDEAANRLLLRGVLEYAGHDVVEARSGEEGLQLAQTQTPDLIILDLYMPGMHGTVFMKRLRAAQTLVQTKVALYTGTAVDAMMQDFMRLSGIEHVIPKPAEPQEIIGAVERALR